MPRRLGVDVVVVGDEATAEREITALLAETAVIGLDIETAPRREYAADAGAALDPLKAEVRLLQIATEFEGSGDRPAQGSLVVAGAFAALALRACRA